MKSKNTETTEMCGGNVTAAEQEEPSAAETVEKENREYKNSVFVDLFYEDETAEKNLLSLYNALHDTDYKSEKMIRKVRVENILYKNFKNDISFEADGKMLVFGEHQSTINKNMPLRCLMYAGRAYEQLVDKRARYQTSLVSIPTPEFYTFYNGVDNYPLENELFLSDAFLSTPDGNPLELKVKVININSKKAHGILTKCSVLREYSMFIDTVRKYSNEKGSVKKAVNECIQKGILADYLARKGSEVTNMLIAEYSYEEDMLVKQEEAREEARKEVWRIAHKQIHAAKRETAAAKKEVVAAKTEAKNAKLAERISLIQKKCVKNKPLSKIADDLEAEPEEIRPLYDLVTRYPEKTADELCELADRS